MERSFLVFESHITSVYDLYHLCGVIFDNGYCVFLSRLRKGKWNKERQKKRRKRKKAKLPKHEHCMSAYYYHSHDPLVVTAVHIALRCVQTLCAHAYVRCETCTLASHIVTGVLACDARARVSQRFIYTPDFLLSVTISRRSMTMFLSADMASTKAKHPRVLQKPCSSKMNASDKLRRMAIKNSFVAQSQYQSPVETPQNDLRQGTFLPPLCQKQMLVTPAAVGNRKQYSTNSLILDVPCVRDDPHTTLSHGLSRQSHYAAGRHSPLTEYESMLWSSYVHSTSDMNMGSGTLERCSSHRNLAARRTNETVRAGYRSANCQMKNDFEPMQRRASSCFNVAVLKPNATVHQRARTRSPAPVPPCSTTTLDFAVCQHLVRQSSSNMVRRVNTPRGNNPHPTGLEFQSPYNRECKVSHF